MHPSNVTPPAQKINVYYSAESELKNPFCAVYNKQEFPWPNIKYHLASKIVFLLYLLLNRMDIC